MKERIEEILDSLAAAFGGHSQYGDDVIGHALAGQIVNNALGNAALVAELCQEAARQVAERWELDDDKAAMVAASIKAACLFALDSRKKGPRFRVSHSMSAIAADEEVRIETPTGTIAVQWEDDGADGEGALTILRIADGETVCVETWTTTND